MTLASQIKNFVEQIVKSAWITSAGGDSPKRNYVEHLDFFHETGDFTEVFKSEVVRIIQEEIKIQMTEVRQDEATKKDDKPVGSVEAQVVSNVKKGVGIAQNPENIAMELASRLPKAALVIMAISLYPIIIKELTRAGGIFDTRFRRKLELEWNGFLDRQTQKNTQLGLRGVRIQSQAGFMQLNGVGSTNTMRLAKNTQGFIEKNTEIGLPAHALRFD